MVFFLELEAANSLSDDPQDLITAVLPCGMGESSVKYCYTFQNIYNAWPLFSYFNKFSYSFSAPSHISPIELDFLGCILANQWIEGGIVNDAVEFLRCLRIVSVVMVWIWQRRERSHSVHAGHASKYLALKVRGRGMLLACSVSQSTSGMTSDSLSWRKVEVTICHFYFNTRLSIVHWL